MPRASYWLSTFGVYLSAVVELWQFVAVQDNSKLGRADNTHISFEYLRRIVLAEEQRVVVFKSISFAVFNNRLYLVKSAEHNHRRCLTFLLRLRLQKAAAKVHIFSDFEVTVRVKKCFLRVLAFPVFVVAAVVPHGI